MTPPLRVLCTATHVPDIGMHSIVIKATLSDKNPLKSTDHKVCSLTNRLCNIKLKIAFISVDIDLGKLFFGNALLIEAWRQ